MTRRIIPAQELAAMAGERHTHFLHPTAVRVNTTLGDACGLTGPGHDEVSLNQAGLSIMPVS